MVRGEGQQIKVHYKGKEDDYLVFIDSVEEYKKWLSDRSIPLAQVVSAFKIFVTHKQGAQGVYDGASKSALQNEFGTSNEDDAITQILEKGTLQESTVPDRQGSRNDTEGPMAIAR